MKYLILITILISSLSPQAQGRGEHRAQMDALKVKFITEELDLTEKEAEEFWPVFYLFEKDMKKIKKSIKAKKKEFSNIELSEQELKTKLSELKSLEKAQADKNEKLILDCIPILGADKSRKLVTVEDKLRKKIGDKIKSEMDKRERRQ